MTTQEQWRDVPGYEGLYQVSDQGRVKSFAHNKETLIKQHLNIQAMRPYYTATLCKDGVKREHRIHRLVAYAFLDLRDGLQVDHINGDKLNNHLSNLRVCTPSQNQANSRISVNNTSGFKGVTFHKDVGRWAAGITVNRKYLYLGLFDTPEEAHVAYCEAARKHFGEFARAR